jgi:hypothetical protein
MVIKEYIKIIGKNIMKYAIKDNKIPQIGRFR